MRLIRRTSACESSNARDINQHKRFWRLRVQRRGLIYQTDQPRPLAAVIRIVGRWDGRPRQQNNKHSIKLPIQRRHQ